jgi:hypothetical protein
MNEIIKKIDEQIEFAKRAPSAMYRVGAIESAERIKEIIQSEQKEPTYGDKIRSDNKTLAYFFGDLCSNGASNIKKLDMKSWTHKQWLDYLNQKAEEE